MSTGRGLNVAGEERRHASAVRLELTDGRVVEIESDDSVATTKETMRHVRAHSAKSNHPNSYSVPWGFGEEEEV